MRQGALNVDSKLFTHLLRGRLPPQLTANVTKTIIAVALIICCSSLKANVVDELFSPSKITVPIDLKYKPIYPDKFKKLNRPLSNLVAFQESIVGIGPKGIIAISKNAGLTWQYIDSQTTENLREITAFSLPGDKTGLVTVGDNGSIVVSRDNGETWTTKDILTTQRLKNIVSYLLPSGKNGILAVGDKGAIVVSEDSGDTWTTREGLPNQYWPAITTFVVPDDKTEFVVVGSNGAIMVSKDDGDTWISRTSQTTHQLNAITAFALPGDKTGLAAVGNDGATVVSRDNGDTWIARDSQQKQRLNAITAYSLPSGKTILVAVGRRGAIVVSRDSGETWSRRDSQTGHDLITINTFALPGDKTGLVAVGSGGAIIVSRDDGDTWIARESQTAYFLTAITNFARPLDKTGLMVVGSSGAIVVSLDYGDTWVNHLSQTKQHWRDITSFPLLGGKLGLVAVGGNGAIMLSRDSGETWQARASQTTEFFNAISFFTLPNDKTGLAVVGSNGAILVSRDSGETWQARASQTTESFYGISVFKLPDDKAGLAAVGSNGAIVVSRDSGETWQARAGQTTESLTDISVFTLPDDKVGLAAVGSNGAIVVSRDSGETWRARASQTTESFYDISVFTLPDDKTGLAAVGSNGAIVVSRDNGDTWISRESQTTHYLYGIATYNLLGDKTRLVAVGAGGTILLSHDGGESWINRGNQTLEQLTTISAYELQGGQTGLVVIGRNGTVVDSLNDGETWVVRPSQIAQDLRAISAFSTQDKKARLVAVGVNGAILVTESHFTFPTLDSVTYKDSSIRNQVVLDVTFLAPANECQNACAGKLFIANKADIDNNREFEIISGELVKSANAGDDIINTEHTVTWQFKINPEDYSINPGDTLYFYPQLESGEFKHAYQSLQHSTLSFVYQFNPDPYWITAVISLLLLSIILLFIFRPILILELARVVGYSQSMGSALGGRVQAMLLLLNNLTIFPVLAKQKRILDSWAELNSANFLSLVEQQEVLRGLQYYPLPLKDLTHNEYIHTPSKESVKALLSTKVKILEVSGAGGSGKSSFAAQVVNWAQSSVLTEYKVLPIWLDEDVKDIATWLINKVRKISEDDSLPAFFIEALFKQSRLMLVADRVSEQSETTQKQIIDCPSFVQSMLVTTRTTLPFEQRAIVKLRTLPLDSKNLMGYIDNLINNNLYGPHRVISLDRKGELIKQIAKLILIKDEQKEIPITPLLAKLFVEKVMQDPNFDAGNSSIIEIYLDYIAGLNPVDKKVTNCLTQNEQLEAVKLVAMAELGDDFKPKWIEREKVTALFSQSLNAKAASPIQRLIDNQILIEQRLGSYLVRFTLDPIAEYIAALAWAEKCGADEVAWKNLINELNQFGENVLGFSLALRVVHSAYGSERSWPTFNWPELNLDTA